ncbi:MAG: VWA domain-containing protein [Deltaproteobacteria bacterium]|nr:VWA domain-containing protein [Deltaproteobacteria bacterium]
MPTGYLLSNLLLFGRLLRALGIEVTAEGQGVAARALERVDLGQREQVKGALSSVWVSRREQLTTFETAFDLFWRSGIQGASAQVELGRLLARSRNVQKKVVSTIFQPPGEAAAEPSSAEDSEPVYDRRQTASGREVLRSKDFAELTDEEEQEVRRMLRQQLLEIKPRKTRRFVKARRGAGLHWRATLRRSLRSGGEIVDLARRKRKEKPRPLVLLCDVSGSMESYSRLLLQFLYVAGRWGGRREAFAFGTRLTRLTLELDGRNMDRALESAAAAVVDWGGGTRIGEALRRFNFDWGRRVLGQGAVVMVISDGWDRGDPELLKREMARLRRGCRRLIWLNPLLGTPGYQPLTQGMRAALPFVDHFLPVHNLRSLEQLGNVLCGDKGVPRRTNFLERRARHA